MSQTKPCRLCGEDKTLDNFGVDNSHADQLNYWCRECVRKQAERNRKKRDGVVFTDYVVIKLGLFIDALTAKQSNSGFIEIQGTIISLIQAMDLDKELLLPILKSYIKKAGRSRYRVIKEFNLRSIRTIYLMGIFEKNQSGQGRIDFNGILPFSESELYWTDYKSRTGRIEKLIAETFNN